MSVIRTVGAVLLAFVLLGLFGSGGMASEPLLLVETDLSPWRGDTGEWLIAGEVLPDTSDDRVFTIQPGAGVLVNGALGRTPNILTKQEFGNVAAHIEFMVPKGSNSGVYFQGRYEIQIFDSWGVKQPKYSDCGGVYQRWVDGKGFVEGHAPRTNASKPPGKWQTYEIVFRAARFDEKGNKIANARFEKVVHNGTLIHENVQLTGPTRAATFNDEKPLGPLMLQGDHGPVAYRNIRLQPLPPRKER